MEKTVIDLYNKDEYSSWNPGKSKCHYKRCRWKESQTKKEVSSSNFSATYNTCPSNILLLQVPHNNLPLQIAQDYHFCLEALQKVFLP